MKNIALITCISSLPVVGYLLYINSLDNNELVNNDTNDTNDTDENNSNEINNVVEKKANSKK